jgi:hypothetical protein
MEDVTKLAEELNKKIEAIEKSANDKTEINALKGELSNVASKEDVAKLSADLDAIAAELKSKEIKTYSGNKIAKQFADIANKQDEKNPTTHVIKADDAFNLVAVAGNPFPSDTANLDAALLNMTAINTGVSQVTTSPQTFVQEIARFATPIEIGDALLAVVPHTQSGAPATVAELKTKPRSAFQWKVEKVESKKIAVEWVLSREYQRRAATLLASGAEYYNLLINEQLQDSLFADVLALGTTFAPIAGLTFTAPNNYDALIALTTAVSENKYNGTHIFINAIDNATMFGTKGADEQYALFNGQSIQLLNGGTQLVIAGKSYTLIVLDSSILAQGTVMCADMTQVKIGLGTSIEYNINPYELFSQNAVVNQLEIAFAAMLPTNKAGALVKGTFAGIIEDITPEAPEV